MKDEIIMSPQTFLKLLEGIPEDKKQECKWFNEFMKNQKKLEPEFYEALDENFTDLL